MDLNSVLASQLSAALDAMTTGVLIINPDTDIQWVNLDLCDRVGYRRKELISRPMSMLIPDRHRSQHEKDLQNYLSFPEKRRMREGRQIPVLCSSGKEITSTVTIGLEHSMVGPVLVAVFQWSETA